MAAASCHYRKHRRASGCTIFNHSLLYSSFTSSCLVTEILCLQLPENPHNTFVLVCRRMSNQNSFSGGTFNKNIFTISFIKSKWHIFFQIYLQSVKIFIDFPTLCTVCNHTCRVVLFDLIGFLLYKQENESLCFVCYVFLAALFSLPTSETLETQSCFPIHLCSVLVMLVSLLLLHKHTAVNVSNVCV